MKQEFLYIVLVYRPHRVPGSEGDGGNTDRLYYVLDAYRATWWWWETSTCQALTGKELGRKS